MKAEIVAYAHEHPTLQAYCDHIQMEHGTFTFFTIKDPNRGAVDDGGLMAALDAHLLSIGLGEWTDVLILT